MTDNSNNWNSKSIRTSSQELLEATSPKNTASLDRKLNFKFSTQGAINLVDTVTSSDSGQMASLISAIDSRITFDSELDRTGNEDNIAKAQNKLDVTSPKISSKDSPSTHETICHGIVKDLEDMVPPNWWQSLFADEMYLKTDGDVVEDPDVTAEEISILERDPKIKEIFTRQSDSSSSTYTTRILDLCCGQGRHSLYIAKKYPNIQVYGHDQSSYLISLATERAIQSNQTVNTKFTIGDCRQIPYPENSFDLVLVLGNSFGYFPEDSGDSKVLTEIYRVLRPSGRLVLDVADGSYLKDNFAERSWEWIDDTTFANRQRALSRDKKRLISREIVTSTTQGVIRDQFYQERLYSQHQLHQLFLKSNITPVTETSFFNLNSATDLSKRQEDLGMMGHRMFVVGKKELKVDRTMYEISTLSEAKPPTESLVVVWGDTSIPCVGKSNHSWNPEDFTTRLKLMTALNQLGYQNHNLVFLENHEHLFKDLEKLKNEWTVMPLVFNLCDEGFKNEALKELHIPAILDILSIDYTGAGPNCLSTCYDKQLVNQTAAALDIHVPTELYFKTSLNPSIPSVLTYPCFIKPVRGDNSLGITTRSIINTPAEYVSYISELHSLGITEVLVQEYLTGEEYSVGMIGNARTGFKFLPILRVDYTLITQRGLPPLLGHESKWDPTSPYWNDIQYTQATDLSSDQINQLHETCKTLWDRFACRDYCRFDFRMDFSGCIKLLEVNPNPGWCWDGKFAKMARLDGLEYHDMLGKIITAAKERIEESEIK